MTPAYRRIGWSGLAGRAVTLALSVGLLAGIGGPAASEDDLRSSEHDTAERALLAGNFDAAAAIYARILERAPDDPLAMDGRIRALLARDDWSTALIDARRYLDAHPGEPLCVSALGEVLLRAGRFEEAKELLDPLALGDAPPARGLMTLSRLHAALGHGTEARELMDRAVALAPDDRELLLRASEVAPDRATAIERLERFLELSDGYDVDRVKAAKQTLKMLRELGDRKIWVRKTRPERMEVPLKQLMDPVSRRRMGYVVQVKLKNGGKPVKLLLDTGAHGLHVVERIAKKNQFDPVSLSTLFGGGDSQRHDSIRGLFADFSIGDLTFANALASTSPDELEPNGRFQGLLGINVFDGYRITLDLKKQRLILEPPGSSESGSRYWTFNGQMLVEAGATAGPGGMFLFDTGAGSTLLGTAFVEQVPEATLSGQTDVRAYGGRVAGAQIARGLQIAFQDLETTNTPFRAVDLSLRSRLGGVEISGFLGLDLLHGTRIVVDTSTRRLVVSSSRK